MLTDLLKTAAKVGLKSAAPVLGTLGSELANTVAGKLIDQASEKASKELQDRLFQSIEDDLAKTLGPKNSAEDIPKVVAVTVRDFLGSPNRALDHWTASDFDPDITSQKIIDGGQPKLSELSEKERALCRLFIEAFYRALAKEKAAIEKTELRFRQRILSNLETLTGKIASLSADQQQQLSTLVAVASVRIPVLPWTAEYSPPGALLRADIDDPVPFHGREDEAESFVAWCQDDRALSVQVITGPGGIGKTRFLLEMCSRQSALGSQAGFLDSRFSSDLPGAWPALLSDERPLVVAIDYAETRPEQVVELVTRLLSAPRAEKTRIVLLARSADDWWEELKRQAGGVGDLLTGPASNTQRLRPLTLSLEERKTSYKIALSHFSHKLGRQPAGGPTENLGEPLYERTLILQMAALAAVEGTVVKGDQGILNYVLQRERRFWSDHAKARDLPSYLEPAISQFMAAITLVGGAATEGSALKLSSKLPLLTDQSRAIQQSVSDLFHEIYPGERWIEPVLPDLLGEHLCQSELEETPDAIFDLVFGTTEPPS